MVNQSKRVGRATFAVGVVVAVGIVGAASAGAGNQSSYHGVFAETATGAELLYDIHGSAKMTIGPDATTVKISVSGLDPDLIYRSHLHNGECSLGSPGAGHYQNEEGQGTTPPNELWLSSSGLDLVPNAGGVAHGAGSESWAARVDSASTNAKSVVVHAPGGAKIGCADLS